MAREGQGYPLHDDDDDIKAKTNKMQQNSKCRLCDDWDKMINHIISKMQQTSTKRVQD